MSKSGLPAMIIRSKIKNSKSKFDTTTESLIQLAEAGVAEEIIAMMIEADGS